jgi:hypothetical protein
LIGHTLNPEDRLTFNQLIEPIEKDDRQFLAETTSKERVNAYKNVYKTNIPWGGGSKEHPGKRRDYR